MTDAVLRRHKEAMLAPVARRLPAAISPTMITLLALVPGLGAAVAAATGRPMLALALWLGNRLLDGMDGTLARSRGTTSDRGAYVDIVADFVVYATIPIGVAIGLGGGADAWRAVAVLLAAFYVNTITWAFMSALIERRRRDGGEEMTTVALPEGLVEGAETVAFYALIVAVPDWAVATIWVMAAAVGVTVIQRISWAVRTL